ncbi:hypothetical protein CFK41_17160 [Brachybacterium ginsengisoli]|uniref:Uncharacterized protein n=1 Tax=Brachybacterium ginsengisoli TaxID=1331682 RepID=A0A291H1J7_9MICO|nr:hypothetical protein CFK41_17160 [Brachybacterium ginsengisoli]
MLATLFVLTLVGGRVRRRPARGRRRRWPQACSSEPS